MIFAITAKAEPMIRTLVDEAGLGAEAYRLHFHLQDLPALCTRMASTGMPARPTSRIQGPAYAWFLQPAQGSREELKTVIECYRAILAYLHP